MKTKKKITRGEQRIINFLDSIDWMFQLNQFDRNIVIKKEEHPENNNVIADITCEENYQRVTVRVYPSFWKQSLKEQRKVLLHELCHSITLPSKNAMHNFLLGKLTTPDQIDGINETETSKIENIVDRLLQGDLRYARRAYEKFIAKN
jgi:hypothetical protein